MNHKNVTSKRATFTKAEKEYVKGIVHNLSFQRFNDREIVQWLHDEKQIDLDRSTVSKMRNQIQIEADLFNRKNLVLQVYKCVILESH
jgi:DNA-directed RNA polymerase specialized sigma54-like protein